MPAIPAGGESGGGGDTFSVSPQALLNAAPTYYQASQNVNSIQQTIDNATQLASGDMFMLLEFAELASRLEQLKASIDTAMQCAALGLNRIGDTLIVAANESDDTDQQVSGTFMKIEDDPPSSIPTFPLPGSNPPGGGTPPLTQPQPQPQPIPQPQPEPLPPIIDPGI